MRALQYSICDQLGGPGGDRRTQKVVVQQQTSLRVRVLQSQEIHGCRVPCRAVLTVKLETRHAVEQTPCEARQDAAASASHWNPYTGTPTQAAPHHSLLVGLTTTTPVALQVEILGVRPAPDRRSCHLER
jgi:hypothetical protein